MNRKFRLIGAAIMLLGLLMLSVTPGLTANKTVYQCNETYEKTIDPGITFVSKGGTIHIRGQILYARDEGNSPMVTGYNTIVFNANLDSTGVGPMWGTAHIVTDEGGAWDVTWAGQITAQGSWFNAAGRGSGDYAGMKLWWDKTLDGCTVTILEH